MPVEQVVDSARDVVRCNRGVVGDEPARVGRGGGGRSTAQRRGAGEQCLDQGCQGNVAVLVETHADLAVERLHGAAQVELARVHAEIGVAQDHAQQQEPVGAFDQPGDGGIAGDAQIGPGQGRPGGGQQAAAHEAGDHRDAELPGQFRDLGLEPVAAHLDVDHDHRPPGLRQAFHDLVGAGRHRVRVGRGGCVGGHRAAGDTHHVARQLDIDRPRLVDGGGQHARDLARGGGRVGKPRLGAGDLLVDPELGLERAALVVQQQAGAALRRTGRTRDHHHRRFLGERTADGVYQVERAGTVGDRGHADRAAKPAGRIRREADSRLMAQSVERQDAALLHHLEEGQREIAGDAEHLPGPVVAEPMEQRLRDVHRPSLRRIARRRYHTRRQGRVEPSVEAGPGRA